MPSFVALDTTLGTIAQVNAQDIVTACVIVDDGNPPVTLTDFTGDHAAHFPRDLAVLTEEQRLSLFEDIRNRFLYMVAGLE